MEFRRLPDDELPLAAGVADDGRAIALLAAGQCAPELLAGSLVEGDDEAVFAADKADEAIAVHEGRGGEAPGLHGRLVLLAEILGPEHLALVGIEAAKVAHGS